MKEEGGVVLALQNVYLKDCSYESPNGPRVYGNCNPQISLDLQTGSELARAGRARGGAHSERVGEAREGERSVWWRSSRRGC